MLELLKKSKSGLRSGGHILVDQLLAHGVDTVFGVPGESYLDVLDGLYARRDSIRFISCRMEAGAANMAEAWGKLTGRPGICMVTRGPGACHAAIGAHIAFQDSTPMILLIGQVAREMRHREAFQEIDFEAMFGPVAKWAAEIDEAARIPEYMARAFQVATSGRPGPVVLSLPEDMLTEQVEAADAPAYVPHLPAPDPVAVKQLTEEFLPAAQKPLLVIGGGGWTDDARQNIRAFAEAWDLPVAVSFRAQDCMENDSPHYVGHIGIGVDQALAARVKAADLLIWCGPRWGEMTSQGYTMPAPGAVGAKLIHIHPSAEELGRVYLPDLGIHAAMPHIASALAGIKPSGDAVTWQGWRKEARADYERFIMPEANAGDVQMGDIMRWLGDTMPADTIITNGAGNYTGWVHRHWQYRGWRSQLAPTCGAMGYSVPAAIAAKIAHPEREVISFNGDGCFMMCGQELATAAQYGVAPLFIIVNNGLYGTIRMHQAKTYPGRISGTELKNPDFVSLAKSYGLNAARVEKTEDFEAAFAEARKDMQKGVAGLIEIRLDAEAITHKARLSALEAKQ